MRRLRMSLNVTSSTNRVVAAPLETRAAIGFHDRNTDRFIALGHRHAVHDTRKVLAGPSSRFRSIACASLFPTSAVASGTKNYVVP